MQVPWLPDWTNILFGSFELHQVMNITWKKTDQSWNFYLFYFILFYFFVYHVEWPLIGYYDESTWLTSREVCQASKSQTWIVTPLRQGDTDRPQMNRCACNRVDIFILSHNFVDHCRSCRSFVDHLFNFITYRFFQINQF